MVPKLNKYLFYHLSIHSNATKSSVTFYIGAHLGLTISQSTNLFTNQADHISTNGKASLLSDINLQHPTIPLFALMKR